jgi:hypothetical protein
VGNLQYICKKGKINCDANSYVGGGGGWHDFKEFFLRKQSLKTPAIEGKKALDGLQEWLQILE